MENENWVNEVLNSTNEMTKVVPNEMLFSKIQNAIKKENKFSSQWIWAAAASFAVLATLNGVLWISKKSTVAESETIASSISKSNQLY